MSTERFQAKEWKPGRWCVCDLFDGGEPLFGDHMPRDREEAEQCARAARLAVGIVTQELRRTLEETINKSLR